MQKSYPLLSLVLVLLSNFLYAQGTRMPELTTIINEERNAFNSTTYLEDDCVFSTEFNINVIGLEQYRINDGVGRDEFQLPIYVPPMYLTFTVGGETFTYPVEVFTHSGQVQGAEVYTASFPFEMNLVGLCNTGTGKTTDVLELSWSSSIITYDNEGNAVPYPICDYISEESLFSCLYFVETNPYCYGNYEDCVHEDIANSSGAFQIDCNGCDGFETVPTEVSKERSQSVDSDKSISENEIVLSPNPANEFFLLHFKGSQKEMKETAAISIYDVNGNLLLNSVKQISSKGQVRIDASPLASGVYWITVNESGNQQTFKGVKLK